jgi:hypothetical protein
MTQDVKAPMITALGGIHQVGSRLSKAIDVAAFGDFKNAAEVVAGAARSLRGVAESCDEIARALAEKAGTSEAETDDATPQN